jgi:DNA invertase Pin-like site-specific DNA recombinase
VKAAIYLRRSTDKQEYSMGDQEKAILEYATQHDCEIVRRFEDDAISGTSVNGREGFKGMIRLGTQKNPPFEAILVYDVSRFSRTHPDEAAHYEFVLRENGVRVIYVAEPFSDEDSVGNMLMKPVKRTLAHMFSLEQAQKVIRGSRTNTERGYSSGGFAPYGYKRILVDANGKRIKTLEPGERKYEKSMRVSFTPGDPTEVAVVRRIFDLYANRGTGIRTICDVLNRDRIPSPGHFRRVDGKSVRVRGAWSKASLWQILHDPVYVGTRVWGKDGKNKHCKAPVSVCEGAHEPLIDKDTFARVESMTKRRRMSAGRPYRSRFLLTGLIRCVKCGHRYHGHTVNGWKGSKHRYYVDGGFHMKGRYVCENFMIKSDDIESFALKEIKERLLLLRRSGYLERQLRKYVQEHLKKPDKRASKELETQRQDIDAKIARWMDLFEMGGVTVEEAHRRLEEPKAQKKLLQGETDRVGGRQLGQNELNEAVREMLGYLEEYESILKQGAPEEVKEHVRAFLQRVEVDPAAAEATLYFYKLPEISTNPFALSSCRRSESNRHGV